MADRDDELLEAVRDLIWLNGVAATELIQITENISAAMRGAVPPGCIEAHNRLREQTLEILGRHCPEKVEDLAAHLKKH